MKKFIRIIFLLLLVQYVFGDYAIIEGKCGGISPYPNTVCTMKNGNSMPNTLCNLATYGITDDQPCLSTYAVSKENQDTHICLKSPDKNAGEETIIYSRMD